MVLICEHNMYIIHVPFSSSSSEEKIMRTFFIFVSNDQVRFRFLFFGILRTIEVSVEFIALNIFIN